MRIYGRWAGKPEGTKEVPHRCVAQVLNTGKSPVPHQCYNRRQAGPGGLYCTLHANILATEGGYVSVPDDTQ